MSVVFGMLRWTVAILAVAGTVALVVWIAAMILRKDSRNDAPRNRP